MAQYCTFYLDRRIFGLDILQIQEIIHIPEITPVPNSPFFVQGLANLRGQIVVTINLRNIFGLKPAPDSVNPVHIIVPFEGEALSLIADRAGDVQDFGEAPMVPPPKAFSGPGSELIKGIFELKDSLLHIIDPEPIFANRFASEPKLTRSIP